MTWKLDARTPVHLLGPGEPAPEGAALITEGREFAVSAAMGATGHGIGCACCPPRSPAAPAFDKLFLARVKGERSFASVAVRTATEEGEEALRWAVDYDPVVSSRFKFSP